LKGNICAFSNHLANVMRGITSLIVLFKRHMWSRRCQNEQYCLARKLYGHPETGWTLCRREISVAPSGSRVMSLGNLDIQTASADDPRILCMPRGRYSECKYQNWIRVL